MSRRVQCIPTADRAFANAATAAFMDLARDVDADDVAWALADRLRERFPAVEVHRQALLARIFDDDVWYAYRDGKLLGSADPD